MDGIRILRQREVTDRTGLSRTTIWRLERRGLFPPRRRLSVNAVGWLKADVEAWIAGREVIGQPQAGDPEAREEV